MLPLCESVVEIHRFMNVPYLRMLSISWLEIASGNKLVPSEARNVVKSEPLGESDGIYQRKYFKNNVRDCYNNERLKNELKTSSTNLCDL